jgi:Uma2 family endonuclease
MSLAKTSLGKKRDSKISEEDYLEGELASEVKHEYIDGYVYAMAGVSRNHNRITNNISRELGNDLKHKKLPCEIFSSDIKVKVSKENSSFFYPDLLISCDPNDNESEYYVNSPVIIVEVLSKSTRKYDLTTKKLYYFNIQTLQEYVVIEQDSCRIEVFKKSDDWRATSYFLGDSITFDSINATISVEDIYYQVVNDEINSL